ncbi:hypothetical protein DN062_00370 [Nitrincola tibetensis]|uniref:DUF4123 domain-containing protein n=1 Tax=Nitrincola tibetensis TaxID=2219697 RepID=A0A364NRS7_9GAMM|nr:DUF4123 domain-containing protein [Nitrincola tibetensis]RAU19577.1 hypothetical protein DN062_00370 [Nitrincola tibetensis]
MSYLLTSFLEDSGLRYQSLFQGKAQEELAEHAPYLVELTEDNHFTCRLFTGPDGIGGLWEKELGIFLRCRARFDALRKHLRKFIRLQNVDGRWFYFRFWEQRYAHCFFSTACAETHWMMMVTQEHRLTVICPKGSAIIVAHAHRSIEHTNIIASKPTQEWVAGLAEAESNRAFQNKLIDKFIFSISKYGHIEYEKAQEILKILLAQAQGYGFESEYALSTYVSVALELSQFPAENECYRKLLESAKHPDTKAELMLKLIVYAKGNADD